MPQTDFATDNRIASGAGSFDKFKLLYGERARIVLLEFPTYAWVHQLRAPKIVDGKPVIVAKKRKARAGAAEETYSAHEMDFIGRPLCLGSADVIKDAGVDPESCPACRRSTESDQVRPPERRFAVNIIRYETDVNGRLTTPFSCRCIVWAFNESTYDRLIVLNEEWSESGGILKRDLLLGPCTSAEFQNFEITPGEKSAWKVSAEAGQRVAETLKANRRSTADLEAACGRAVNARWMAEDIERITERWAIVDGRVPKPEPVSASDQATLADGLDALLNTTGTPAAPAQAATTPQAATPEMPDDLAGLFATTPTASSPSAPEAAVDLDALLNGSTPAAPAAPPAAAPPATAPAAAVMGFDELLNL